MLHSRWSCRCSLSLCLALAWALPSWGATCVFKWEPVTTLNSGAPIQPQGYRLYQSITSGVYAAPSADIPLSTLADTNKPSYTATCSEGYYWIVRAYTSTDEGAPSREQTVPSLLYPAGNFRLKYFKGP